MYVAVRLLRLSRVLDKLAVVVAPGFSSGTPVAFGAPAGKLPMHVS
jgi:hypothetical protein